MRKVHAQTDTDLFTHVNVIGLLGIVDGVTGCVSDGCSEDVGKCRCDAKCETASGSIVDLVVAGSFVVGDKLHR